MREHRGETPQPVLLLTATPRKMDTKAGAESPREHLGAMPQALLSCSAGQCVGRAVKGKKGGGFLGTVGGPQLIWGGKERPRGGGGFGIELRLQVSQRKQPREACSECVCGGAISPPFYRRGNQCPEEERGSQPPTQAASTPVFLCCVPLPPQGANY